MRYLIATRVGGIMETPHVTYENKQWIEATTPEQAVKIYNDLNNCNYYYGEVIGTNENLSKLSESDRTMDFEYYTELLIDRQYESEEERAILEQLRDELYYEALNELLYEENQQ